MGIPLIEGRTLGIGDTAIVVGVVGDVVHNGITGEVNERFYRPQALDDGHGVTGSDDPHVAHARNGDGPLQVVSATTVVPTLPVVPITITRGPSPRCVPPR